MQQVGVRQLGLYQLKDRCLDAPCLLAIKVAMDKQLWRGPAEQRL